MMSSQYYRDRAEELRAVADTFCTLECKEGMLKLADQYDRQAIEQEKVEMPDEVRLHPRRRQNHSHGHQR